MLTWIVGDASRSLPTPVSQPFHIRTNIFPTFTSLERGGIAEDLCESRHLCVQQRDSMNSDVLGIGQHIDRVQKEHWNRDGTFPHKNTQHAVLCSTNDWQRINRFPLRCKDNAWWAQNPWDTKRTDRSLVGVPSTHLTSRDPTTHSSAFDHCHYYYFGVAFPIQAIHSRMRSEVGGVYWALCLIV